MKSQHEGVKASGLSRRNFFAGAAAMGAAAAMSFAGCSPKTHSSEQKSTASNAADVKWNDECEVLVVGSGYAGCAAAYEAAKAGAKVRLIEKHSSAGGNSMYADGQIAVVGSAAQKAEGIEDSMDAFLNDALTAGLNLNFKSKLTIIGEKSNETFEWARDEIGVEWKMNDETGEAQLIAQGGHTVMRCIPPAGNSGSCIVKPLLAKLSELGVECETNTQMVELIRDDSGRAVGVQLALGCTDYDPSTSKETEYVKATRGIVLATGGFGKDVEYRSAQDPRLDDTVGCTNYPGATSHGLACALKAGVLGIQLDQIQCYPYTSPLENSFGATATWIEADCAYAPTVDPATGRRVVNELTDRKKFSDAMFAAGHPLVQIGSSDNVPEWCRDSLEAGLQSGVIVAYDSLDEVAAAHEIPLDALKAQMEEYNGYVKAGEDAQFGKLFNPEGKPVENAPFYVATVWPKVHHCMGGVYADDDCRVLDQALNPIEGLFAAGEATGGVHGACRLGCNATLDCLVNGRIAGQNAAANSQAE